MYQSLFGLDLEDLDSLNHLCSEEVWLMTKSKINFIPREWTSESRKNSGNVSDTIAVGVFVRGGPDLVDRSVFPPGVSNSHIYFFGIQF